MTTPQFDEIGVVLGKDSYGKFYSKLVLLKDGEPVEWRIRTENRALGFALRDCAQALDEVSLKLNRREMEFSPPPKAQRRVE